MSIPIQFDDRDMSRGILVAPAWYFMRIDSVTTKPSKDKQSTNWVMEGTIICNADDGGTEFKGVVITWNFNSKAKGFMVGLFKALIGPGPDVKLSTSERYDLEGTIGKELDVLVENGEWEGRIVNRVNHRYRYPKALTPATPASEAASV